MSTDVSSLRLTPRNWINLAVVLLALASVVAQRYGFEPLLDYGYTATQARDVSVAFAIGAFFPGSPIGRVLDYVASRFGGPPAPPPSATEVDALRDLVRHPRPPIEVPDLPRPRRVTASLALVALSAALALGGCALLVHGCGGSPIRTQAAIADVAGATLDTACQELDAVRAEALAEAAEHERPELAIPAVARVRAEFAAAAAGCNLIADAHDAWFAELERAVEAKLAGRPYTLDVGLALRLLASWPHLQDLLAAHGVFLLEPPGELLSYEPEEGEAQ